MRPYDDEWMRDWLELPNGIKLSILKDSKAAEEALKYYEQHKNDPPTPATITFNGKGYR